MPHPDVHAVGMVHQLQGVSTVMSQVVQRPANTHQHDVGDGQAGVGEQRLVLSAGVRSQTAGNGGGGHPIRHPTWEEMHTVLPWYCMSTVSMQLPIGQAIQVPSNRDTCLRATWGAVVKQYSPCSFRRDLERLVIPSKFVTPGGAR